MEALEMVLLIMFALLVGSVGSALFFRNEANEWRNQVDDERTR
jgi:hypothetical protein